MPDVVAPLPLERYLELVGAAAAALVREASAAGPGAEVPTCPRWRAADLVAHQGMVHRWAAAHVLGHDGRAPDGGPLPTARGYRATVPDDALGDWLSTGAGELVAALASAPEDLRAMTFLRGAPPPRLFWARRQTHETTVHAVDALAARLGRTPTTGEAVDALRLTTDVAVDGLDELLGGFITRGRARIARERPYTVAVAPADADVVWTLHVDEGVTTTVGREQPGTRADVLLTGTAADLYLGLWNRGDGLRADGLPGFLATWRSAQRVRWS